MTRCLSFPSLCLAVFILASATLQAGPPLLCHPIEIGAARSLPWGPGPGWNAPQPGYDRGRLVSDTLALLAPSTPVPVRRETLRRAAVYAMRDLDRSRELLSRLEERAQKEGSVGDGLALFDVGYLIETYKQARLITGRAIVEPSRDGTAMMREAVRRRGEDAAIDEALVLIAGRR
jgi:hypothetical protein